MGLLSGLMGHASAIKPEDLQRDFGLILVEGETIEIGFKVIRDLFVFTNKRLILVNKQGLTGSKTDMLTIPYQAITYFSKESSGILDLDAELQIWVRDMPEPIRKEFGKNDNVNAVYQILSRHILK